MPSLAMPRSAPSRCAAIASPRDCIALRLHRPAIASPRDCIALRLHRPAIASPCDCIACDCIALRVNVWQWFSPTPRQWRKRVGEAWLERLASMEMEMGGWSL